VGKECYLVGNYLSTRAKAAIKFDNHTEAEILAPLLEHTQLLTKSKIEDSTDIPVTQYLLRMLNRRMK